MSFLRKQDGQPDCQPRGIFERLRITDLERQPMLQLPTPLRGSCRSALALLALFAPFSAYAEKTPALEPLIVSALRVPQAASTVTSAVTVLDPKELESQGILQLRDALNASPGVISTSTGGQTGSLGSLFIRGTTTQYAQLVVDGMRLNDSNNYLGPFLGSARTYDIGNIEILRGPQGAIYGGESIGGVVWIETPHGSGSPHGSTTVEAGSFDSFAAHAMFQGETDKLSYYLSGGYEETDNDAPRNHFQQASSALRVEGKVDSIWTVGTTFRSIDSSGQDLDTSSSKDSDSRLKSDLSTVYAVGKISDRWTSRFNVGYYQESYDRNYLNSTDPVSYEPSSTIRNPSSNATDLRAGSISTDQEITLADNLRFLAGAFAHKDSYESVSTGTFPSITDKSGDRYGAHTSLEWDLIEHLTATGSLRWEDYDTYGQKTTWRLGSIYNITSTGTSFRSSVGTSFRAPTYYELTNPDYGNPHLAPESSLGWEFGAEQKIGSHHTLETTWFKNQISDQIGYGTAYHNVAGVSTTDGLELGLRGNWLDSVLNYRLAWTYLHHSLSDQPRNAATASIDWKPTAKSLIGIGATHLSEHSWGGDPIASYTLARLYSSYQLTDKVKLNARVDNVFDKSYQLGNFKNYGDPAVQGAGTGIYAGITVDW
jgi:iron complex outermembrane receptor protein